MKKFFVTILATACCMFANAQSTYDEYVSYPYGFVGVQGGLQSIFIKHHQGDFKVSPTAALNFGSMFNPYLGARLDFRGVWDKITIKDGPTLKYNSLTADLDLLLNLTNCFRSEKYNPLNIYFIAGGGVCEKMDNKNVGELGDDKYNIRAGFMADYRLSKIVSVNLELDANYVGGAKSAEFGNGKWKPAALLGLAFKLPFNDNTEARAKAAVSTEAPVTTANSYDAEAAARAEAEAKAAAAKAAAAKAAAAQAAAAKAKAEAEAAARNAKIEETIFFTIGKTDSAEKFESVVSAAADWCKKTGKVVEVSGYADKGTGSAKVNARVAKARATAVADAIKAKGVPADQIKVSSFGDKVQPYAENDQNRCVIVVGK